MIASLVHRIRRWCWQFFGPWDRRASRCIECGAGLSPNEREYYGSTCERCEGQWMNALESEERP